MAPRDRKVLKFSRGYRPVKKFDMGLPPRTPKYRILWRRYRAWVLLGLVLFVAFLGPLGDTVNAYATPHDGCRVMSVIDGDTIKMRCPLSGAQTGRILGLDTPELGARCTSELLRAVAAKYHLRWMLWKATHISARTEGTDRYNRKLVVLLLDGQGIAHPMIKAGWAREYSGGRRDGWCDASNKRNKTNVL